MGSPITVFTPTYNRAGLLKNLYHSLLTQSNKNFTWLIVDDGSVDETRAVVEQIMDEKLIGIQYIYQQNQGKHIAINTALKNISTDFFLILDSDDVLLPHCIETFQRLSKEIINNDEVALISSFILRDENFVEAKEIEPIICWEDEFYYLTNFKRENFFCFKTSVLKNYPFPQFPNEKFCPESLIFKRIARKYKILFFPQIVAKGNYLEGGLTSKYWKLLKENPLSSTLWYKEQIKYCKNREQRKKLILDYWMIAESDKKKWRKIFNDLSFQSIAILLKEKLQKRILYFFRG